MKEYEDYLVRENAPKILSPINKNNEITNIKFNFERKMITLETDYPRIREYTIFQVVVLMNKLEDDYAKLQKHH